MNVISLSGYILTLLKNIVKQKYELFFIFIIFFLFFWLIFFYFYSKIGLNKIFCRVFKGKLPRAIIIYKNAIIIYKNITADKTAGKGKNKGKNEKRRSAAATGAVD